MQSRSLWHYNENQSGLEPEEISEAEGTVLVHAAWSLISHGTEVLVATGGVPESLQENMKVPYMGGHFGFPVKYGYSLVGRVMSGPPDMEGRAVHLMHPHQDRCRVRLQDCTVLPETLPLDRAALFSNLETALTAVWDSGLSAGDRLLVVGFGLIGALTGLLARSFPGVKVWVSETDPLRREKARDLGFFIAEENRLLPVDIAFHTSHTSAGLQLAINAVGPEGRVVELSWYGKHSVQISLGSDFHYHRKQIFSSQVSHIPAGRTSRWDLDRRKRVVLDLLQDPELDQLLDVRIQFEESPAVFDVLRKGKFQGLSCLISYL